MKYIVAEKQQMSQVYSADGKVVPVTILKADPMTVTQIRTAETDGYSAVVLGGGIQLPQRIAKAQLGAWKDLGNFKYVYEFRPKTGGVTANVGDKVSVEAFAEGDAITVTATSKGKGFQGGVKRYGFAGGDRSHGNAHAEREVGSIGATGPQRVFKGKRMPGRMGSDTITVKGLKVVAVDAVNNLILVSGAVPGHRGTRVEIKG
jgi:large subunit ribosomal protein L3